MADEVTGDMLTEGIEAAERHGLHPEEIYLAMRALVFRGETDAIALCRAVVAMGEQHGDQG